MKLINKENNRNKSVHVFILILERKTTNPFFGEDEIIKRSNLINI
jgi:hypothetical protein